MSDTSKPTTDPAFPTPTGVRVLRLIEYVYDNAETAAEDMARWTLGKIKPGLPGCPPVMIMRSATLPFSSVGWATPVLFETVEVREPSTPFKRALSAEMDAFDTEEDTQS